MIKQAILLAILFVLSISSLALAAEGDGRLEGQLVNGTANGSSVASQEVTLKIYKSGAESGENTTTTDAEGRFTFEGLSTAPEYSYEVTLFYQTAEYYSDAVRFQENENSASVNVTVWDATGDVSVIKVDIAHTIVYTGQGSLKVTEYYSFVNDTDKTYIGFREIDEEGTKETLNFSLPANISDFQASTGLMDCCTYGSEEGFIDTMAVMPGGKEIVYSYTVSTNSDEFMIPKNIYYPTGSYDLLVQGSDVKVDVNQMKAEAPITIEGTQYSYFTGSDLAADNTLMIRLSGLPQASGKDAVLWMILTLVVLGGGFGLYYARRQKKAQPVIVEDAPQTQQQKLLARLAKLDDDFERGNTRENVYRRQRDETKAQLMKLMK